MLKRSTQSKIFTFTSTVSLAVVAAFLWFDPILPARTRVVGTVVLLVALLLPRIAPRSRHLRWLGRPRRWGRQTRRSRRLGAQVESLTKLCNITEELNSSLELDALLERLGRLTASSLEATSSAVLLTEGERLVVASTWGPPPWSHVVEGPLPAATAAALLAIAKGREAPAPAVEGHVDWPFVPGQVLVAPMRGRDELDGLLVVHRATGAAFSPSEREFLDGVAVQAALAIANARLYTQALELSLTDPLTGLGNRRHLLQRLELEFALAERTREPLTIAVVDIDHFKKLNDTGGHAAGDEILKTIAALLQGAVRRTDMVARLGGEEFCLVLPNLPKGRSFEVLDKVRRLVREHGLPPELAHLGTVTISIGTSTSGVDGADLATLFDAADAALYHSKRTGRDRTTTFVPGMELHPCRERGAAKGKSLLDEGSSAQAKAGGAVATAAGRG